jgi:alkaline phosphatase D
MKHSHIQWLSACYLAVLAPVFGQEKSDTHHQESISKIAFGSCFDPRKVKEQETSIFDAVLKHQPDVFVFLGDNIYGDTDDMDLLRKKYAELEAVEGFQKLRDETALLATWDDHDYGINDGGKSYSKREESAEIFLDFFKVPSESPRRERAGIYGSHTFGSSGKICQILLLDTRYFRDELPRSKSATKPGTVGWYEPTEDQTKTLLGEDQWEWLERQLAIPADLRIIASSIQILASDKGMENWGNTPHEQQRLFDLLKKHRANHTFAISGDVHFAELSKKQIGSYPFYDLTSSGLQNTSKSWSNAKNSLRVGESYWQRNAGLIEIDWGQESVQLSIINADGEKVFQQPLKFSELEFE